MIKKYPVLRLGYRSNKPGNEHVATAFYLAFLPLKNRN